MAAVPSNRKWPRLRLSNRAHASSTERWPQPAPSWAAGFRRGFGSAWPFVKGDRARNLKGARLAR